MARKPSLIELLGSPVAQSAIQQLAGGMDPRLVAAQFAGTVLTQQMAKQLGAPGGVTLSPAKKVVVMRDADVIDAEFTPIPNSAPKRRKKE